MPSPSTNHSPAWTPSCSPGTGQDALSWPQARGPRRVHCLDPTASRDCQSFLLRSSSTRRQRGSPGLRWPRSAAGRMLGCRDDDDRLCRHVDIYRGDTRDGGDYAFDCDFAPLGRDPGQRQGRGRQELPCRVTRPGRSRSIELGLRAGRRGVNCTASTSSSMAASPRPYNTASDKQVSRWLCNVTRIAFSSEHCAVWISFITSTQYASDSSIRVTSSSCPARSSRDLAPRVVRPSIPGS